MWLWIIATVAAFYVKGLCGFANTLVFTSILGFGVNNINISPVEILLSYPANIIMTWKNRDKLNPRVYIPLALLVLSGCIPGAFLLKNVNAQYIKVFFGIVVVNIGVEMLLREYQLIRFKKSNLVLVLIGILSGLLCGLFGVGALVSAYVGSVTESSDEFKATINAVFTVENTFRIILYYAIGVFTFASLRQALMLIPFVLLGLWGGMKSCQYLNEKAIKKLVIVLLILSGMVLIVKNI